MIYATSDDLVTRYGEQELIELTDLANTPPEAIDAERVAAKIDDACAVVDSYIGQVYQLPLTGCAKPPTPPETAVEYVAPPALVRITCDLARYFLHYNLAPENEVYRRYKDAMKELEAFAAGKAQLTCPWGGSPGTPIAADAQSGGNEVSYEFSPRAVTDDSLVGFG